MSEVKTSHELKDVLTEFDNLLENLEKLLKEVRPRTNIRNTKLGKIRKDLSNITNLDKGTQAKVAEIAIKFNTINSIFNNDIEYNKKDLAKIIEGKHNYQIDSNERYNDSFFELSMGLRFLLSSKGTKSQINLDSDCDIIVNNQIAIECKYIHSSSNLVKNIKKANKQINARIANGQAKYGYIALDLSHICPREKIEEFANYTFNKFLRNYQYLEKKNRIKGNLLERILVDNNFYKIINSYIMNELEVSLYGELGFSYDMGDNTVAIIFQTMLSLCFEHEDKIRPLTMRGMTYFLNRNLNPEATLKTQSYIHSLAVGI